MDYLFANVDRLPRKNGFAIWIKKLADCGKGGNSGYIHRITR